MKHTISLTRKGSPEEWVTRIFYGRGEETVISGKHYIQRESGPLTPEDPTRLVMISALERITMQHPRRRQALSADLNPKAYRDPSETLIVAFTKKRESNTPEPQSYEVIDNTPYEVTVVGDPVKFGFTRSRLTQMCRTELEDQIRETGIHPENGRVWEYNKIN